MFFTASGIHIVDGLPVKSRMRRVRMEAMDAGKEVRRLLLIFRVVKERLLIWVGSEAMLLLFRLRMLKLGTLEKLILVILLLAKFS